MAVVVEHCFPPKNTDLDPGYYLEQAIVVASQQGARKCEEQARQMRVIVTANFEGADNGMH